jgi:ankyrin repeat protein
MRTSFYTAVLARVGMKAATLGVLVIPIVFVAAVLVERGARSASDVNALYAAAGTREPGAMRDAVARLVDIDGRDHCLYTPLALMAAYGRLDAVEMLLARGAAVDAGHPLLGTPLMLALRIGNLEIAHALLARGADLHVQCAGNDALASAVLGNNPQCVGMVLAAGADPHAVGRRFSLLTLAVQPDDVAVMRQLLAAGVDPNLADADGTTPLLHAVACDATESARLLLLAGADISRTGADGGTPFDVARRRAGPAMLELLESVAK